MDKEEFLSVRKFVGSYDEFEKYDAYFDLINLWLKYLNSKVYEGIRPFPPSITGWTTNFRHILDDLDVMKDDKRVEKLCYIVYLKHTGLTKEDTYAHANTLIVDRKTRDVWIFEPNGSNVAQTMFRDERKDLVKRVAAKLKYRARGVEEIPWVGPQSLEHQVKKQGLLSIAKDILEKETEGYCAAWSSMFTHYIGLNPDLNVPEIMKLLTIRFSDKELAKRIRAYAGAMYKYYKSKGKDLPIGADEKYVIPQSDTLYRINQNCKIFLDQISGKEAELRDIRKGIDIPAALFSDQIVLDQLFYCGVNNRNEVLRNFRPVPTPQPPAPAPKPAQKKKAAPKFKKPAQKKKAAPRKQRKPVQKKKAAPKFKKPAQKKKKAAPRKQRKPARR